MGQRILVTGAAGLVAGELLTVLATGPDEIVPLGRHVAALPGYRQCDLADAAAIARVIDQVRPDAVVHVAGSSTSERHQLYRDNVLATVHLLEAVARLPRRPYCIVFGSAAEYGEGSGPIPETAPLRPVTEYGRAKAAQTTIAEVIAGQQRIPMTVVRPFNLVSPKLPAHTALGTMRRQLLSTTGPERLIRCGRLDVVRDFVPVALIAEAVRRLLARPAGGRQLNLCTGVGIELGAVLQAMADRLGVELKVVQDAALSALPAANAVVGDATALRATLGLEISPTPAALAAIMLG